MELNVYICSMNIWHISLQFLNDEDILLGLVEKRMHWSLLNHIIIDPINNDDPHQ